MPPVVENRAGNNVEQPQIMSNQLTPPLQLIATSEYFFVPHPQLRNLELPGGKLRVERVVAL
jgi:hypothetical protein